MFLVYDLEVSFRNNEIVSIKPINIISSSPNYPEISSSISYNISEEKCKKVKGKTITEKLLEEAIERAKMSGDFEKI